MVGQFPPLPQSQYQTTSDPVDVGAITRKRSSPSDITEGSPTAVSPSAVQVSHPLVETLHVSRRKHWQEA